MKNIPEINHCEPNPDAYWCPKCKAHNQFSISVDYDTHHGTWDHSFCCKECDTCMFVPNDVIFVVRLVLIISFVSIVAGFAYPHYGLNYALGGAGGFCLLMGLLGLVRPIKWSSFNSAQTAKSSQELKEHALSHRCQPTYYDCESFVYWAEQFLTSEEVQRLREKYGNEKEVEKASEPESLPTKTRLRSFCEAMVLAIGIVAIVLYFFYLGAFDIP